MGVHGIRARGALGGPRRYSYRWELRTISTVWVVKGRGHAPSRPAVKPIGDIRLGGNMCAGESGRRGQLAWWSLFCLKTEINHRNTKSGKW